MWWGAGDETLRSTRFKLFHRITYLRHHHLIPAPHTHAPDAPHTSHTKYHPSTVLGGSRHNPVAEPPVGTTLAKQTVGNAGMVGHVGSASMPEGGCRGRSILCPHVSPLAFSSPRGLGGGAETPNPASRCSKSQGTCIWEIG